MAVTSNPFANRQRNPLVEELLRQAARDSQAAMSTTAGQYAAEAYGGNFPIGTLTSQILKGVTARSNIKEAKNLQAQENQIVDLLKQNALNEQLPDNKYFDETGQVRQMTGGPAEGSIVNNQIQVTPQSVPSSVEVGKDSSFLDRFVNGAINAYKIENKNQAMADVGISSDDLDLYKRQKQGTLTPVTLYRGEEAVPVLMKTDDRGSFVNYTDLKGNELTDSTGLSTSKSVESRRDKFMKAYVSDFTIKSNIAGRDYDIEEVVRTANRLADELNIPKDNINTTQNDISIIEDDLGFGDIMDSLNGESKTDKQKDTDDTLVKPRLSKKEQADIEKKTEETKEKKRKNIQIISTDVGSLDLTRSKIATLKDALPKIEQLYKQLEDLNITGRGISASAFINTSGPAAQLIGLINTLKGSVFVSATGKLKEAGGGSTGMGSLTEVEGEKIQGSEGQVKVDLKNQTINTLKKVLKELQEAEARKLKYLQNAYEDEYKQYMVQ